MLNCGGHTDHMTGSVSKWPTVNFWENHVNSFQNLLLIHQSECYQNWVTTLGHGKDVKLPVMPIT